MVSWFEMTLPQGELSKVHDDEDEEQLVDYEPSLALEVTHTKIIPETANDDENDDATSKSTDVVENLSANVVDYVDNVDHNAVETVVDVVDNVADDIAENVVDMVML